MTKTTEKTEEKKDCCPSGNKEKCGTGKCKWLLVLALIVLLVLDFLITPHHVYFPWDSIPGANAVIGIGAAIVIIMFSRMLGALFVQQNEDYYCDCKSQE
jgi:hypothetical protein